jgi:carboxyl-terminal processing protease
MRRAVHVCPPPPTLPLPPLTALSPFSSLHWAAIWRRATLWGVAVSALHTVPAHGQTPPPPAPTPPHAVIAPGTGLAFSAELARATFDSAWSRIANTHYDPAMGGIDWDGVRTTLRPRAEASQSNAELRQVLREMLGTLGLSHFAVFPAESGTDEAGGGSGDGGSGDGGSGGAGPGLELRWIDESLLVLRVREGSAAALAGIQPGWEVLQIGGWSPLDLVAELSAEPEAGDQTLGSTPDAFLSYVLTSTASNQLSGATGTHVEVLLRGGDETEQALSLRRNSPPGTPVRFGNLPPIPVDFSARALPLPDGGEVGWIRFSAWFPIVAADFAEAVDRFRGSRGMIVDLRGNPGGVGGMIMGVAGHFYENAVDLGEMTLRDATLRFPVNPQRVTADGRSVEPFAGPVAILVDPMSASTSELFAAGLQATGRARIFGETTAGQALPAVVIPLPNGDRLMHVIADYTAPGGIRLEGRGVIPDVLAPPSRAALLEGEDTALTQALIWIAGGGELEVGPLSGAPPSPIPHTPDPIH